MKLTGSTRLRVDSNIKRFEFTEIQEQDKMVVLSILPKIENINGLSICSIGFFSSDIGLTFLYKGTMTTQKLKSCIMFLYKEQLKQMQ